MISTLHIKNIGIIDDLSINLNQGLNILTGETGAGKTLIIDSLGIISGERFSKEMIRKGEDHSFVEVCLYLPENENAIDGNVASAGFGSLRAAGISTNNETLEQNVVITAEFPNATDHNEIEQAFDSLINRAAQFANRKK